MNIGGVPSAAANLAGQALPPRGADADRAARETANKARADRAQQKAEAASDVGETQDDVETHDGDPDGRQLYDFRRHHKQDDEQASADETHRRPPDPSGELGNQLDLEG